MRILVVQESDWLKRNPHQQHHLMERLSQKAHEIRVIDYDIDWRKEELIEKSVPIRGLSKEEVIAEVGAIKAWRKGQL